MTEFTFNIRLSALLHLDINQEIRSYVSMGNNLSQIAEQLSQTEVFGCLTDAERLELAGLAVKKSRKKGAVICFQGDEHLYDLRLHALAVNNTIY